MRAFAALTEEASPLESFRARTLTKNGWVQAKPSSAQLEGAGVMLESLAPSSNAADLIDEDAHVQQQQAWRASCVLRDISVEDALAIASLVLGEESFTRSSSERDCFFATFEVHDGPSMSSKRLSNQATSSSGGGGGLMSSPTSSPASLERQRLPVPLTKTSSTSSRASQATASNPFVSASDPDEDDNTSNDEGGSSGATAEAEGGGLNNVASLRRRISRIATATLRRSVVRSTSRQIDGSDLPPPRTRKMRFFRRRSENCVYCVDEDQTIEPFEDELENVRRARVICLGVRVEPLPVPPASRGGGASGGVTATLVFHADPRIERAESGFVNADLVSAWCGKARAEELMARLVTEAARGSSQRTWLRLRADWTGKSVQGEPWEMTADREPLQVGCIVRHAQLGTGWIECFDMRGTFKVRYDGAQGDATTHGAEDKDKLKVVLGVGHRVRHRSKGPGTVQSLHLAEEVRVRYDDGRLRGYAKDAWQRRLRRIVNSDEDEPLLRFSLAGHARLVEGLARVQFVVHDATPEAVLKSILRRSDGLCPDEKEDVSERRVLFTVNDSERVVWEQRNMPRPLTPRSFVYKETHGKCMGALLVLRESTRERDLPDTQGVVRGFRVTDGWVIEPIQSIGACFVTRVLCLDLAGFIAPEAVCSVRESILTLEALSLIHEFGKHRND